MPNFVVLLIVALIVALIMNKDMKGVNPQKLQMQIGDVIKKYKLTITKPSVADVAAWIERAGE